MISESFHISLCTLKKEIKKWKLELVTQNEFYKTVVESFITITSTEKNEFEGSVLECVIKFPTS